MQAAVESEAADHADDRWWILEPTLITEAGAELSLEPAPPGALESARVPAALALHVDLELGGEPIPAIVVAARGRLAEATLYARVERTEAGTPRLGPWQPAPELAPEVRKLPPP